MRFLTLILAISILVLSCKEVPPQHQSDQIDAYIAQYSPYDMHFDASGFGERDQAILKKLVQAAQILDTIYWMQTSKAGFQIRDSLRRAPQSDMNKKLLTLLERNTGPFELLNDNATFVGTQKFYAGNELYPPGITSDEFDAYLHTLAEDERAAFMSPYTVIKKKQDGSYDAVPYHIEYQDYLTRISALLRECADLSDNRSFSKFLRLKADALLNDQYFDADVAWIDMEDSKFDIVFGPFETYSDEIKGVKAKYEASIEVIDQEESKNLALYTRYLKEMENNLPVPDVYKSQVKGLTANFVIVRDIYRAGEAAAGYQAVATNLPNDPEVHEKKGTKKTFWKNMFEARFNTIIKPVSLKLIADPQQVYLSDQGFFQFVLMHEICHAVGPRTVKVGPKRGMATNAAIGPNYNALEEAKADITGLHSLYYLMDNGVIDKSKEKEFLVSYLGSLFRSIRFGVQQAHGKAATIELNYFIERGCLVFDRGAKRWSIDFSKIRHGVSDLARELVILEGDGDGSKVEEFFGKYAVDSPELKESLDIVRDIAIDVLPRYTIKW